MEINGKSTKGLTVDTAVEVLKGKPGDVGENWGSGTRVAQDKIEQSPSSAT